MYWEAAVGDICCHIYVITYWLASKKVTSVPSTTVGVLRGSGGDICCHIYVITYWLASKKVTSVPSTTVGVLRGSGWRYLLSVIYMSLLTG